MPLTAYVNGDRIIGPLLDEAGWENVLTADVQLYCGAKAKPKRSKLGTRFFAHWPGSHCDVEHKPESEEHLAVKESILRAAIAAGWDAAVEVPASDRSWIADVLVTDGTHRIALEVQWSYQTADDYHYRQDRYRAAGVDCYWFSRHRKTLTDYKLRVPVFRLVKDGESFNATHGSNTGGGKHSVGPAAKPVERMVTNLLSEYPRRWVPFQEHRRGARIYWRWEACWSCQSWLQAWKVDDEALFRCLECRVITEEFFGAEARSLVRNPWPAEPPREFDADILSAVRQLDKPAGQSFRTTKRMPTPHHGYACPSCSAPISFALMVEKNWNNGQSILGTTPTERLSSARGGHWCAVQGR